MRGRSRGVVAVWLVLLTVAQVAALLQLWRFFVRTRHGQLLDTIALTGNSIGQDQVDNVVGNVLNTMSVVSLAAATAVIGFIALIRRRFLLALVSVVLIAGANLTAQLLKAALYRPELGVDEARAAAGNSFPSGHTTIAASVAVALVLVLPAQVRGLGALIGVLYTAVVGVATLSAGWHRPSDAVGAVLIAGGWAAVAALILLLAQRDRTGMEPGERHRTALTVLLAAAGLLLVLAALALALTDQVIAVPPDELGSRRLLVAYAGSAAGIAGTSSLVVALLLAAVHHVVPRRVPVAGPGGPVRVGPGTRPASPV